MPSWTGVFRTFCKRRSVPWQQPLSWPARFRNVVVYLYLNFESFTSIIYSNFYHIYADYAEFWAVWGLILANDTATCAARPVCKPKVKCNQRVLPRLHWLHCRTRGFLMFFVFGIELWRCKTGYRVECMSSSWIAIQHLFRSFLTLQTLKSFSQKCR